MVTNVEPDHLDHYGTFDAVRGGLRRVPGVGPDPRVVGGDDPEAPRPSAGRVGADRRARDRRHYRMSSVVDGPELGGLRPGRSATAPWGPPGRGGARASTTPANAAVAAVAALGAGAPVRRGAGPWPASPGWPGASSSAGEVDGVTFVDDYAHLPTEVAGRPGRRPQRRLGAGGGRVPAPPLHAARPSVGAAVRGRLRRRRRGGRHRRLRRRRGAGARRVGTPGGRRRRGADDPGVAGALRRRAGPSWPGAVGALLRPGDLC